MRTDPFQAMAPCLGNYPIADAVQARVVKDYIPDGEYSESQLVLSQGDVVWVLERHNSGWWGGHKEGEDLTGWFPEALVRLIDSGADQSLSLEGRTSGRRWSPATSPREAEALCTNDLRVVASPQMRGCRRLSLHQGPGSPKPQLSGDTLQIRQLVEAMEGELSQERTRTAELLETLAQVRTEAASLRKESERCKQEQNRVHNDWDLERRAWDQERHQWERRVTDLDMDRQVQEQEVLCLQLEIQRKEGEVDHHASKLRAMEGELGQQTNKLRALEMARGTDGHLDRPIAPRAPHAPHGVSAIVMPPTSQLEPLAPWWLSDGARLEEPVAWNTASGPVSRGSSSVQSRLLFSQASTAASEGSRTPPTGSMSAPTMPLAAGAPALASTAAAAAAAATTTITPPPQPGRSLSVSPPQPTKPASTRRNLAAGFNQPPRPPLRTASTAPPWMAGGPGAVTGSPRQRARHMSSSASAREDSSKIEVRALVSAFEQKSTSQGPSGAQRTHRACDTSPSCQVNQVLYAHGATTQLAGRRPASSSSRNGSREVSVRPTSRGHSEQAEPKTPKQAMCRGSSAACSEEAAVNYGLSPLQPQPHTHHMARGGRTAGSPSPSRQPISVQDRIRHLNGGRLGR